MGQITIHLDMASEAKAMDYAKTLNISIDKWIAGLIMEKTHAAWPESVKKLEGSWPDFPTIEEIRSETGKDVRRDGL